MVKTLLIPLLVGLACLLLVAIILHFVMPFISLDDSIKGIIKLATLVVSFALPADYLRKKAKAKLVQES